MNGRQILTVFLFTSICGTATAQNNEFDFGGSPSPETLPQSGPDGSASPDDFDILNLPDELFGRKYDARPRKKLPPLRLDQDWDYRFDAQYQSTIKPYMRWYMRQNPATPRKRYLTKEYRAGRHGWVREADGFSAYSIPRDSYGRLMYEDFNNSYGAVRYWDHLNWLHQQYSKTPIDRSFKVTGRPIAAPIPLEDESDDADAIDLSLPDLISETQPGSLNDLRRQQIWVCRHRETGRLSVLFVEPLAQSKARFFEAQAALTGPNSILALKWKEAPTWADHVKLKAGQLQSTPSQDKDQVASAS